MYGGAGDDTLTVNNGNSLAGVRARVVFDGAAHIEEITFRTPVTDPKFAGAVGNAALFAYVNSDPAVHGTPSGYALSDTAPIVFDNAGEIWIRAVVLHNGFVGEDYVQTPTNGKPDRQPL